MSYGLPDHVMLDDYRVEYAVVGEHPTHEVSNSFMSRVLPQGSTREDAEAWLQEARDEQERRRLLSVAEKQRSFAQYEDGRSGNWETYAYRRDWEGVEFWIIIRQVTGWISLPVGVH